MININAYDVVEPNFYKTTYVRPTYKKLYSKEIKYKTYYGLLQRYNSTTRSHDYYLFMTNLLKDDIKLYTTGYDKNGTIKINLGTIWYNTNLKYVTKDSGITIKLIEEDEDSALYYLDI